MSISFVRLIASLLIGVLSAPLHAQEQWLGIYLQGQKIGYARSAERPDKLNGKAVSRVETTNLLKSKMLGSDFEMRIEGTSWVGADGKPVRIQFSTVSSGRKQNVLAEFRGQTIDIRINNSGAVTLKKLLVPAGARVVDDATFAVADPSKLVPGKSQWLYVLDPVTVALVKNEVVYRGRETVRVPSGEYTAHMVEVIDPRATTKVYLSSKGDLVKVLGPIGMEMLPETKHRAMDFSSTIQTSGSDLAYASSVPINPPIERIAEIEYLKLKVTGMDLSRMPSGGHQDVAKQSDGWTVTIHPVKPDLIAKNGDVAGKQSEWLQPDLNIPSDDPALRKLAREIVADEETVVGAAQKIRAHVYGLIRGNTTIAILRDAREILKTREGLCRDHAILSCTLLRAAGVPSRLATGLVYQDSAFFYHAWVEFWDGSNWIGLDSTRPQEWVSVGHLKLAQGALEDAFLFFVLDGAKLKVVESRSASPR